MNKQTAALIALFAGWILTAEIAKPTAYEDIAGARTAGLPIQPRSCRVFLLKMAALARRNILLGLIAGLLLIASLPVQRPYIEGHFQTGEQLRVAGVAAHGRLGDAMPLIV